MVHHVLYVRREQNAERPVTGSVKDRDSLRRHANHSTRMIDGPNTAWENERIVAVSFWHSISHSKDRRQRLIHKRQKNLVLGRRRQPHFGLAN